MSNQSQRGICLYLGVRTEFRTGCSGWNCKHNCEAGHEFAIPGQSCQGCHDWVDDGSPQPTTPTNIETAVTIEVPPPVTPRVSVLKWEYGVTTVPSRRESGLLQKTLKSLAKAGFDTPRLFIDGVEPVTITSWEEEFPNLLKTYRNPAIRAHGNWILSMYELYLRNPNADRYALFQDDCLAVSNLKAYLESVEYPSKGYLNLYLFPQNMDPGIRLGRVGWYPSNQRGLGAVGLVFDRANLMTLLTAEHMVQRVIDPRRGHRAVDGGIVDSMKKAGCPEFVHFPSLLQHTGEVTSIEGNRKHPTAESWPGENFDPFSLFSPK